MIVIIHYQRLHLLAYCLLGYRMLGAAPNLLTLKRFLRHAGQVFNVDFSVILWDGDCVPLCERPTSDLALRLHDPGVITSLLRSAPSG